MKKRMIIVLIGILIIFTSCQKSPSKVELKYSTVENIEYIELLSTIFLEGISEVNVLYTLSKEQMPDFLCTLLEMEIDRTWSPGTNWGYLCVRISYVSGEQEILGSDAFEYISASGEHIFDGWHSISYYDLYDLFSEYVEKSKLPLL